MRDPILAELRRIREKQSREAANNPNRVAESYEILHATCDVVVSEDGERHYITSATKMREWNIATRNKKRERVVDQPAAGRD